MLHRIPIEKLGAHGQAMGDAVTACVHCGFCLPSCPTYQVLGQEMDSPRGRIYLMKEVLEGRTEPASVQTHIDRCLGCMACESSCPSGVEYHQLLLPYRARTRANAAAADSAGIADPGAVAVSGTVADSGAVAESGAVADSGAVASTPDGPPWVQRLKRSLVLRTLPYPARFRAAVRVGNLTRWLRPVVPRPLRPMLDLLPTALPPAEHLPEHVPAVGTRRGRVALLTGCVQRVIDPAINRATVDVLIRNGIDVVIPRRQGCCGALAWHSGAADDARRFGRAAIASFPSDIDALVVNAAGCGSGMKEYPLMFAGEEDERAAQALAERIVDVSVFLDRIGLEPTPPLRTPLRVAYHDACHLCHAQQIRAEPRRLLRSIPGLELVELDDGELCCGSAGTYNIDQPDIAAELGRRKAEAVRRTRCDLVATGNIGCLVQLRSHLRPVPDGLGPTVLHTAQVLALAYAGRLEASQQVTGRKAGGSI